MQVTRSRQVGAAAIACALLLRLFAGGGVQKAMDFLARPNIAAFLIYLETGRDVRFSPSLGVFSPDFVESPPAAVPEPTLPPIPSFAGSENISVYYAANKNPDLEALLTQTLSWNLYGEEPTVLILHTHSTESYTRQEEPYTEVSAWRTLDESYNMLAIGAQVAQILNEAGIPTIQDAQMYDYPSYSGAYVRARKATSKALEEYPSVLLVLDLHRDASEGNRQMRTQVKANGEDSAQLMVVVGTNHENYEQNLSLGLKLHAQLEQQAPGIMRPLQLRAQRFNQDLCPASLIIEVGSAGNTHAEARRAAQYLAEAIIALARGTQ